MNKTEYKNARPWAIFNIVIFIAMMIVNYLGGTGKINNLSQAEVSGMYPTLITPAGFAFSIWGVIYVLVGATLIYFLIKANDMKVNRTIALISPLFIASSILNIGWIVSFSYDLIGLSTVLILVMAILLVMIIGKLNEHRRNISYLLPAIAFTLYASWVFIASFVNVAAFLVKIGWNGFGISDSYWTISVIVIAIVAVLAYALKYKNALSPAGVAWAFFAIHSAYKSGEITADMSSTIEMLLLAGIVIFVVCMVFTFVRNKFSIFPKYE